MYTGAFILDILDDLYERKRKPPVTQIRFGQYQHVRLSVKELYRLYDVLSYDEIHWCIRYIDEYIETHGNRHHWMDFYLLILKCSREEWYLAAEERT